MLTNALLLIANIIVVAVLAGLVYFLNWSGPGFAAGCIAGAVSTAFYIRYRLSYWP